jgi:hypothetical protein
LDGSSKAGEGGTIVDTAGDDTAVEEGFLEGCFGERRGFVGLNVLFVDEVEFAGVPVDVVNDSIDVVEKDVGVAVDTFEHIDIGIIVPVGELSS